MGYSIGRAWKRWRVGRKSGFVVRLEGEQAMMQSQVNLLGLTRSDAVLCECSCTVFREKPDFEAMQSL